MSISSPVVRGPVLENGDRLSRDEFHRLYVQTDDDFRAELIGGVVYVSSPLRRRHGTHHVALGGLLFLYQAATPGVEAGDNATDLLGDDSEPQPDLYLRILPGSGGRTEASADDYVVGPPELIIEVAHSSRAIDLNSKLDDYARYGAQEYLVVCLAEWQIKWFDLPRSREFEPDDAGVYRIHAFPGLWIDSAALFEDDSGRFLATAQSGIASPEQAEFVQRLQLQQQSGNSGQ